MQLPLSFVFTTILLGLSLFAGPALAAPDTEPASLDDLIIPRKPIPYGLLGVNAFANDQRFGSIRSQFREVRATLGLRKMRVLFAWNDQVQPSRNAEPFFGFYDEIVNSLPAGSEALVILTGAPSWMSDSRNWVGGNPRTTFIELWVKKVAARYARRGRIKAYQLWNEPNNGSFPENAVLGVLNSPENFVELVAKGHAAIKAITPRKKVVNGATTAIAQNFPETLEYNEQMVAAGILSFTDAYAIHFYGKSVERVLVPNGVGDFLKGISEPIWVTESGEQGINEQTEYAERVFPFLKKEVPGINRIYLYQFTEASPAESTYGLRNLTRGFSVSDLFIKLRERMQSVRRRR